MSRKITSIPINKSCKHHHKILPAFLKATARWRFYQYSSGLKQNEILPIFINVTTRWNFTRIAQGYNKMKFYQYFLRLQILSSLSTGWKYQRYAPREQLLSSFPTRENINIMHQGNSFSALSPQEKISILCTKGTASQLFPHKRKYQYYAPREQLLSFFPTRTSCFNYNTAFYWSRRGHQLIL